MLTSLSTGRFRDAELATESIHSSVQLLSLYHDLLLFRATLSPSSPSRGPTTLSKSLHARYTRFWTAKSTLYRRVAIVLQMVQYTELLLEMWAKRRGEAMRWRVVVIIEAVKAFCRLLLLRITRSRPLVTPVLPERETVPEPGEEEADEADDGKALAELMGEEPSEHAGENGHANGSAAGDSALVKHDGTNGNGAAVNGNGNGNMNGNGSLHKLNGHASTPSTTTTPPNPQKEWSMPRTGLTLPSLPARGDISTYLLSRVLTADDIKPATKLLHSLAGSAHTAEVLHILAPLAYAIALSRTGAARRRTSWAPWLVGLSVQLAARQLAARAREGGGGGGGGGAGGGWSVRSGTALEKEEWARRGRAMWWWLMRGAAYENVVKGVVGGVRRRVPGFVGTILEDYEYLWENYYFSTSDS